MSRMFNLKELLEGKQSVALGGHVRPDGDCAGSCMGLYNYVRENFPEKEIDVYLEELPNTLKFMKNTDKIRHEVTEEKTYDLFIALECGDMGATRVLQIRTISCQMQARQVS